MRIDSSGNVGIGGTTSVTTAMSGDNIAPKLIVEDDLATGIGILRQDTSIASGNSLGSFGFYGTDTTSNTPTPLASMQAVASGTHSAGDNPTDLRFFVTPDGSSTMDEAVRIDSSGNVGIGCSPSDRLEVKGATAKGALVLSSGDTTIIGNDVIGQINFKDYDADAHAGGDQNDLVNIKAIALHESGGATALDGSTGEGYALSFSTSKRPSPNALFTVSEAMRIDSSGQVGINTTSPETTLDVNGAITIRNSSYPSPTSGVLKDAFIGSDDGTLKFAINGASNGAYGDMAFLTRKGDSSDAITAMTIDSSGNVLIGTDSTDTSTTSGFTVQPDGQCFASADGQQVVTLSRLTSDGEILRFRKGGTTVGSIASRGGTTTAFITNPSSGDGAGLTGSTNMLIPSSETGVAVDNRINLGSSSARFKDLYLGGTSYVEQYSAPSTPTIADDAFYTLTPQETIGFLLLGGRNDNYDNINGLFSYRVVASTYCTLMSRDNTSVETAEVSGAPTITDYTDGKVTVVVSDNGNIYIANREGGGISVNIILFGQ